MVSIRGIPSVPIGPGLLLMRKSGAACPRAAVLRSIAGPGGMCMAAASMAAGTAALRTAGFWTPVRREDPRPAALRRHVGAAPLRTADRPDAGRTGTPAQGGILRVSRTDTLPRGGLLRSHGARYRLIFNQMNAFLRFPAPSGGAASTNTRRAGKPPDLPTEKQATMASNEIPKNYTDAVALAEDAADGAQTHGVAVGLKQNTAAVIRADLDALTAAEETAAVKRTAKATAATGNKTADSNGKAFIARFIQLEKPRIGSPWGPLWQEAGFSSGSISMPGTQGDRFVLIGEIKKFLGNHPECVITDAARPDLDVTEAVATAQYLAISAARTAVNDKTNESSAAATARETALDALRRRLGGLRDELTQLPLPADSPLWYAFGFNRPADPATPGTPENLVLATGAAGTGTLIADWNPARRATGYRVKVQVTGEAQPHTFGLFADDQTTLIGLPLGVVLTVTVTAHNEWGDGASGAPGSITLN